MSMNNNSNNSQQNLCKQGCGFYGNAQNMDMCSKCYQTFLETSSGTGTEGESRGGGGGGGATATAVAVAAGTGGISISEIIGRKRRGASISTGASAGGASNGGSRDVSGAADPRPGRRKVPRTTRTDEEEEDDYDEDLELELEQYATGTVQPVDLFRVDNNTALQPSSVDNKPGETEDIEATNSVHSAGPIMKKPRRCEFCRRKVGLTGFDCRCGGHYCSVHRYSDKHSCTFDYQAHGQEQIKHQNPMICGSKIKKI